MLPLLSVKGGTSERCYRTRRGRTDEQRYAIISLYFDRRIKMNGPYPDIANISFLAKLFFKTFISISTFEDCRTLSGPKELLKTIIELSLTKDIYLTLIKDMYWSKWLLCSYSCFSWQYLAFIFMFMFSLWFVFVFVLFYEYLKWIKTYCIFDRGEVASSWMLHEEMF